MDTSAIRLPPGWVLDARPAVGSTNDEARALISAGSARDGTIVWAGEQQTGRGRRGRAWESPPGNLYHSYILRALRPFGQSAQLSFVAAIALAEGIEVLCPLADPRCKWPNDILCHGGKVSGMLLETVEDPSGGPAWLILGIGVNVATAPVIGALYPAVALADMDCAQPVASLLEAIAARMAHWVAVWRREGFAPVREAWLHRALGIGHPIEVRLADGTLSGVFRGLDDQGGLILEQQDGISRTILAGDVFLPGLAQGAAAAPETTASFPKTRVDS